MRLNEDGTSSNREYYMSGPFTCTETVITATLTIEDDKEYPSNIGLTFDHTIPYTIGEGVGYGVTYPNMLYIDRSSTFFPGGFYVKLDTPPR
jgi:hypothetical protein